jgi:ERCC4-type nuclease
MKYLLVDSREHPKAIRSIIKYFDSIGLVHESTKLLIGDYQDFNRPGIIVDRKQNIAELAKNCTADHERFRRELERAKKANTTLVVLVEQNRYKNGDEWIHVDSIEDLLYWSSPHTEIRGEKVYRVLASWIAKYPIEVRFCDKRSTGKEIIRIIYGEDNVR